MVYIFFSHQSCTSSTLLLPKKEIYPHKSDKNLVQLIFFLTLT